MISHSKYLFFCSQIWRLTGVLLRLWAYILTKVAVLHISFWASGNLGHVIFVMEVKAPWEARRNTAWLLRPRLKTHTLSLLSTSRWPRSESVEWSVITSLFSTCFKEPTYKTTTIYYCTPIRMAKVKKPDSTSAYEDAEKLGLSYIAVRNAKWYSTLETAQQVLIKLNIHPPYDPAILPLDIYPREMKTYTKLKNTDSKGDKLFHSIYKTHWKS